MVHIISCIIDLAYSNPQSTNMTCLKQHCTCHYITYDNVDLVSNERMRYLFGESCT